MTAPPLARAPSAPGRRAVGVAARYALARRSFVEFLCHVRIEEVIVRAGEEFHGGVISMEPWPHLVARAAAWDAGANEVILKARQLGLSWLAAAYAVYRAQRPGSRVLLLSKGQLEAYALLEKCRFIIEHLPPGFMDLPLEVDNEGQIVVVHGGTIVALPSTKDAGRSFTATLVIADEAAFHVWAAQNYKAYRPTVGDGGQLIILSTANGVGGFFHDQFRQAEARSARLAELVTAGNGDDSPEVRALRAGAAPVFIPWDARRDRDEAWLAATREAFEGLPDEFSQEYPLTAAEAFVQLTGLVFPQADVTRHGRAKPPVPWEQCLYRYGGYDLGGGDPTAMAALGVFKRPDGAFGAHLYGYYYRKAGAPGVSELHQWLTEWDRKDAPMVWLESDPKDAVVEESLRALGHHTRTADWSRGKGLGVLAQFLELGWFSAPEDALDLWHEFASYRWLTTVDPQSKERYATGTPTDHHGDLIDAIRYALMGVFRDLMNKRRNAEEPVYEVNL